MTHAKTMIHFDFDGNIFWDEPVMWWLGVDALKISPSGYLYYNDGEYIVCMDSQGKTVWAFHNIFGGVETLSFDEDSNAYMVGSRPYEKKNEQGIKEEQYETSLFQFLRKENYAGDKLFAKTVTTMMVLPPKVAIFRILF